MKYLVLAVLILAWMGLVYAGLVARGAAWPVFVILACIGPLVLVTVISLTQAAAWLVLRVFHRR